MNKKTAYASIGLGLMVALTLSPHSSVLAEEIDEIVVSATGIPTPVSQIGASVDVITAEDLERQQITYLQDALKLKGINVPQNGGPGTLSNVFMRGLPGKYTNLVVDGISMFDPGSNQVLWNDVITDGVGQVEILRGAQGVLYGSNTIAGVISQFTAIGGEKSQNLRVELGEYGTKRLALTGKGEGNALEYGYAISKFDTEGFSAAARPERISTAFDDDAYNQTTMNGKILASLTENLLLQAVIRHVEGEVETDSGAGSDNEFKSETFERTAGRIALEGNFGDWVHQLGVTLYDSDVTRYDAATITRRGFFGDTVTQGAAYLGAADSERLSADYKSVFQASDRLQVVIGADSNQTDNGSNEIDVIGAYALIQSAISDALIVTLATRQDDHDLFGTHSTYRATAVYQVSDGVRFRAAHGTGFRAPSLSELYTPTFGNDALEPETSVSSELGFDANLSAGLSFGMTAYMAEVEDIIGYDISFVNQQVSGTTEVSGLETALSVAIGDGFSINLDAAYTDSDKPNADGSGDILREVRVPRVQAGVSLDWDYSEKLNLGLGARHVKDVEDVDDVKLDDYTLVNLRGAFQINENLKAYARLENAADEEYETVSGYSTPGRAFYVGVTSSF